MSTNIKKPYNKYLFGSREIMFAPKQEKNTIHQVAECSSQPNKKELTQF
jgi:hypothetical protein